MKNRNHGFDTNLIEVTGQSAKRSPTVFVLYEKMPGQE
jgi:hypothetical protein